MLGVWDWMLKLYVLMLMLFLFWFTLLPLIILGFSLVCMVLLIDIKKGSFGILLVIWPRRLMGLGYALKTLIAL